LFIPVRSQIKMCCAHKAQLLGYKIAFVQLPHLGQRTWHAILPHHSVTLLI